MGTDSVIGSLFIMTFIAALAVGIFLYVRARRAAARARAASPTGKIEGQREGVVMGGHKTH